jgi:hypothetical protein
MAIQFRARYDGKVFVPLEPVALEVGVWYDVTVDELPADVPYVLDQIAALSTDMGVTDLAERHKEYALRRKFGGKLPE